MISVSDVESQPPTRPGSTRALVALLAFVLGFATVPHRVCERDARKWLANDKELTDALANGVARWTEEPLTAAQFSTGSARFDGEWMFGTYVMAALGFGQVALAHEDERAANIERMERCLDHLDDPNLRAFDRDAWGNDAIETLGDGNGHIAYLGYASVVYALHRRLVPDSRFNEREQAIIDALEKRIAASPIAFVETYPGERYPVDNATVAAALALHERATNTRSPALPKLMAALHTAVDSNTQLLNQAVAADATPRDGPRASGTALAAYLLSYADPAFSKQLFRSLEKGQFRTVLGFGAMMEHPPSKKDGKADIDSGPVVLGFGVSASGFALGASKANNDSTTFTSLYATAHLFGAPFDEDGARTYATGGAIGDTILFAMLTAPPAGKV
jgi:hypothetical protein